MPTAGLGISESWKASYPPETTDRINAIVDNIGKSFTEVDIPSDINVLSHSEGAIDPYTFLDLPR